MFLKSHGTLFGAYTGVGSAAIEHDLVESIMVAVNSVNECPYCDGLHGELARIAGVEGAAELRSGVISTPRGNSITKLPAVVYAKAFGEADGRGAALDAAYELLVAKEGDARAASIRALATFLMWGSLVGNTVNCTKKRLLGVAPLSGTSLFGLLVFAYYAPLFFLVYVVNLLLAYLPKMATQAWFFKLMGVVLWTLSAVWIVPLGLLGMVLSPCVSAVGQYTGGGTSNTEIF